MDECKGCRTYTAYGFAGKKACISGIKPHLSETEQCPCLTCLVKSMCQVMCEDLHTYVALIKSRKEMNL